tara:strand:+ start:109 stop:378 length:270 start_codon:yes stop_codon:yes gene_type:complete
VAISKKHAKRHEHMTLKNKVNNPHALLDEAFKFAEQHRTQPMALGAALMIVAKTIYLNTLGPQQTSDMLHLFADNLNDPMYEIKKETIH